MYLYALQEDNGEEFWFCYLTFWQHCVYQSDVQPLHRTHCVSFSLPIFQCINRLTKKQKGNWSLKEKEIRKPTLSSSRASIRRFKMSNVINRDTFCLYSLLNEQRLKLIILSKNSNINKNCQDDRWDIPQLCSLT